MNRPIENQVPPAGPRLTGADAAGARYERFDVADLPGGLGICGACGRPIAAGWRVVASGELLCADEVDLDPRLEHLLGGSRPS